MAWTSDKIKQLTKLWNKGKSTVEIARELGISKNAVVGKVHRLGLDARPSPIRAPQKFIPIPQKNVSKAHQKGKTSLLDLKINSCRWPYGEPGTDNFHFCGKDAQTGKPYCPEHCKVAYTSLKELAMESARNKKENKLITVLPEEANIPSSNRKNADINSSNPASDKETAKIEADVPAKAEKKAEKKAVDKSVKASAKAEPAKKVSVSKASAKTPAKAEKKTEKKAKKKEKAPQKAPKEPQVSQNLLSKGVKSIKEKLLKGSNKRK